MHGLSRLELPRVKGSTDPLAPEYEQPLQPAKAQDLHVPSKHRQTAWQQHPLLQGQRQAAGSAGKIPSRCEPRRQAKCQDCLCVDVISYHGLKRAREAPVEGVERSPVQESKGDSGERAKSACRQSWILN